MSKVIGRVFAWSESHRAEVRPVALSMLALMAAFAVAVVFRSRTDEQAGWAILGSLYAWPWVSVVVGVWLLGEWRAGRLNGLFVLPVAVVSPVVVTLVPIVLVEWLAG